MTGAFIYRLLVHVNNAPDPSTLTFLKCHYLKKTGAFCRKIAQKKTHEMPSILGKLKENTALQNVQNVLKSCS